MADSKIADLTAVASVDGNEILYLVDDPGGTPLDRKVTVASLTAYGATVMDANWLLATQVFS